MTDPDLALALAVRTALLADAAVSGLCGGRVVEVASDKTPMPYVEIGASDVVADAAEGLENSVKITLSIDVLNDRPGKPAVKKLCAAIRAALDQADLTLALDLRLVELAHTATRTFVEEDGRTYHGVVTFTALIDEA